MISQNGKSHTSVPSRSRGYILAIWAAVLWGVSGTAGQFLFQQRSVGADWLVTVRMLIAGALLLGFSAWREGPRCWSVWRNQADRRELLLFSLFGMLAVQYTYFAAIAASNAATATVLQYLGPVFITGHYAVKESRLPSRHEAIALIMAVVGTFLLVTHGAFSQLAITGAALFWGLASAVALAFYSVQPLGLLQKYDASVVIGWAMLMGGAVLAVFTHPWKVVGVWDGPSFLALGFIVLFGTVSAFYSYLSAVKLVGARVTSLLACTEPLSAALVAVTWLGVGFGCFDWLGSAFIVGTIAILAVREKR